MPEVAMLENFANQVVLSGLDERADLHGAAALGAAERIDLVDAFDEHRPAAAFELRGDRGHGGGEGREGLASLHCGGLAGVSGRYGLRGGLFGALAAGVVGVAAVIADNVATFLRPR